MSAVPSRLRGEQLTTAYGNKTIAESLNVTIPDGHFTAIIGPNGCGKSTLLRTLSRLMTPASGHVWLDGAQISSTPVKRLPAASGCWRRMPPLLAISRCRSWWPAGAIRTSRCLPAGAKKMKRR